MPDVDLLEARTGIDKLMAINCDEQATAPIPMGPAPWLHP